MNDASHRRLAAMLVYDTSSIQRDLRFLLGSFRTSVHVWGCGGGGSREGGKIGDREDGTEPGCGEARRPSSQSTLHSVFRVSLHGRAAWACVCDSCTWRTRRIAWGFGDRSRAPSFRPPCRIADSGLWWPYFIFSDKHTTTISFLASLPISFGRVLLAVR